MILLYPVNSGMTLPVFRPPSSTLLASLDLLELLPGQTAWLAFHLEVQANSVTYFNCAEKSSLVSSSSQLSSHRCVLSPGTSVSSCVQSAITQSSAPCLSKHSSPRCVPSCDQNMANILSTGKSSNSSSSSSAAAGFPSFDGGALLSAALEAGAEPDVGAADITRGFEVRG